MIRDPIRQNIETDEFVGFYCWAELPTFQIAKIYESLYRVFAGNIFRYIELNKFCFDGQGFKISLPCGQRSHRDSEYV